MVTCSNCGVEVGYGSEHARDNGTYDSVTWVCGTAKAAAMDNEADLKRQLKIARSALAHISGKPLWRPEEVAARALAMMDDPKAVLDG